MKIDIKEMRERARPVITQKELASRVGKTQSQISRYEENPEKIPIDVMIHICTALGEDISKVLADFNSSNPIGIDPGDPYIPLFNELDFLEVYINKGPKALSSVKKNLLEALIGIITEYHRKPRLMLVGAFDSGKSTVANALLGARSLPTSFQPATKVVTYIRHIEDKPDWLQEEVLILRRGFNPLQWDEKEHCIENKIVAGNLKTLDEYGTHNGSHTTDEAAFALVYLDSPLLRACDMIDLPGFENSTTDSGKATAQLRTADIVIFTCPYIGFMAAGDILRLTEVLRWMPHFCSSDLSTAPLLNLFIVATHASISISDSDLSGIIDSASKRIQRQLSDFIIPMSDGTSCKITSDLIKSRIFPFFYEQAPRRVLLEESLNTTLGTAIPGFRSRRASIDIISFKETNRARLDAELDQYREAINDVKDTHTKMENIAKETKTLRDKVRRMRESVIGQIKSNYLPQSIEATKTVFNEICDRKYVEALINNAEFKDKSEATKFAPAYVWEHMYGRISSCISKISKSFADEEITPFIEAYRQAANSIDTTIAGLAKPMSFSAFNAKGAFLGGLAGLGVVGALAIWAAGLGNLGAYIIAAKLGTVLAALGISISGGTAAITAAMAALGGPIGIAIGIVFVGALVGLALFKSWKRKLAERIVKLLKKKETSQHIVDSITTYWDETTIAFEKGADSLESSWQEYVENLKNLLRKKENLEAAIKDTTTVREFIGGLPWQASESLLPNDNE